MLVLGVSGGGGREELVRRDKAPASWTKKAGTAPLGRAPTAGVGEAHDYFTSKRDQHRSLERERLTRLFSIRIGPAQPTVILWRPKAFRELGGTSEHLPAGPDSRDTPARETHSSTPLYRMLGRLRKAARGGCSDGCARAPNPHTARHPREVQTEKLGAAVARTHGHIRRAIYRCAMGLIRGALANGSGAF